MEPNNKLELWLLAINTGVFIFGVAFLIAFFALAATLPPAVVIQNSLLVAGGAGVLGGTAAFFLS